MTATETKPDWRPIETAPKDGTRVSVTHSRCAPGYGNATGVWNEDDQKWVCSEAFITPNMMLLWQPDRWRPMSPALSQERGR